MDIKKKSQNKLKKKSNKSEGVMKLGSHNHKSSISSINEQNKKKSGKFLVPPPKKNQHDNNNNDIKLKDGGADNNNDNDPDFDKKVEMMSKLFNKKKMMQKNKSSNNKGSLRGHFFGVDDQFASIVENIRTLQKVVKQAKTHEKLPTETYINESKDEKLPKIELSDEQKVERLYFGKKINRNNSDKMLVNKCKFKSEYMGSIKESKSKFHLRSNSISHSNLTQNSISKQGSRNFISQRIDNSRSHINKPSLHKRKRSMQAPPKSFRIQRYYYYLQLE